MLPELDIIGGWGLARGGVAALLRGRVIPGIGKPATGAINNPSTRNILQEALDRAVPTSGHPGQYMATLDDGTKVLFRRDFGANAHGLGRPYAGKGRIDHYNIEVQIPPSVPGGRVTPIENIHIVPDGKGGYIWWGKDGVMKP